MNSKIPEDLIERAHQGKSTKEDALLLLEVPPFELFRFADELRDLAAGDTVTYVVNRNINFTSRCVGTCGFCAFRTNDGKVLSIEEIMEKVREAEKAKPLKSASREVCFLMWVLTFIRGL